MTVTETYSEKSSEIHSWEGGRSLYCVVMQFPISEKILWCDNFYPNKKNTIIESFPEDLIELCSSKMSLNWIVIQFSIRGTLDLNKKSITWKLFFTKGTSSIKKSVIENFNIHRNIKLIMAEAFSEDLIEMSLWEVSLNSYAIFHQGHYWPKKPITWKFFTKT